MGPRAGKVKCAQVPDPQNTTLYSVCIVSYLRLNKWLNGEYTSFVKLKFADYTVLFGENSKQMEIMINEMNVGTMKVSLKINMSTTKKYLIHLQKLTYEDWRYNI